MERARRLRALWNWLPVFRAVAETEHLPTAADALFISPASLSRTIGLLEEEIGIKLFDRVGRGLRLNRAGHRLLNAVRDGMRVIDDGVVSVEGQEWSGAIVLWAPLAFAEKFLLSLATSLRADHSALRPVIQSHNAAGLAESILRGQIDFALTETPPAHNQLRTEAFTTLHYGVYCHPGHSLAKPSKLKIEQVLDHPFAIPPHDDPAYPSPWPAQHLRTDVMVVDDMNMAIRACHSEQVLAVLPAVLASGLHRLPLNVFSPATLYAVYREPIGDQERMQAVMKTLSDLNIS
jgi:DNA-binding transcriptional LysR family regulator